MSDMIAVPESLRFWLNPENRASIESVMKQKSIPKNLEWDDVVAYHKARFAVQLLQHEFYLFSVEAWKATWGAALEKYADIFQPIKSDEYLLGDARPKDWLSPEDTWDDALCVILKARGMNEKIHAVTMIYVNSEGALEIAFRLTDFNKGKELSDAVSPAGDSFGEMDMDDNGSRCSKAHVVLDASTQSVSVAELRGAAEAAVAAMKSAEILQKKGKR